MLWRAVLCCAGEGRVHACLRDHRKVISEGCKREEMLLEQQEAEHIELRPNLLKACADERQSFCKSVQPGSGRVFRCGHPQHGLIRSCSAELFLQFPDH